MFATKYEGIAALRSMDDLGKRTLDLQYIMMIFGVLSILVSLANFSICIWIRFDLDFWEWVLEIQWYTYWNATYIVMVAMVFFAFNSGLLVYGIFTESRLIILLTMILRCLIWIISFTGVVVICMYGVEESKWLHEELHEVFRGLVSRYDDDDRVSRIMKKIQEYVGCCGAGNNREDYFSMHKVFPFECRHPVTGNSYTINCPQGMSWYLEPWTATLSSISLFFWKNLLELEEN